MIACASRPSRRSSQDTCEPMPGTSPKAITSNSPPSDSFAFRAASISATMASLAAGSRQRTGESSTSVEVRRRRQTRVALGRASPFRSASRGERTSTPERAQERLRQRAGGHARGGLARGRALEHVAHVGVAELLDPGEVGVARAAAGGPRPPPRPPATGSSAPPSSGSRGSRSTAHTGLPSVRPWRIPAVTSARSFSIFMRPPRPWPSWRRARSRSMSSGRELEARGQPLDDGGEPRTVGFPGGYEAERHGAHTLQTRVRAPGWRRDCVGGELLAEGLPVLAGAGLGIRCAWVEGIDSPRIVSGVPDRCRCSGR